MRELVCISLIVYHVFPKYCCVYFSDYETHICLVHNLRMRCWSELRGRAVCEWVCAQKVGRADSRAIEPFCSKLCSDQAGDMDDKLEGCSHN